MVNDRQINIGKRIHEIVKSESTKRNETMKSLVQDAIIEYFERHKVVMRKMITNKTCNPKDIELGEFYDYFDEYINNHTYFNIRSLSIEFLMSNESLTYNDASKSMELGRIKNKFSKITREANQQEMLKRYNKRTFRVIKKV